MGSIVRAQSLKPRTFGGFAIVFGPISMIGWPMVCLGQVPALEGPELAPPAEVSRPLPVKTPAPIISKPITSKPSGSATAVLAVPGLNGPGRNLAAERPSIEALPSVIDDGPSLDGPIGMPSATSSPPRSTDHGDFPSLGDQGGSSRSLFPQPSGAPSVGPGRVSGLSNNIPAPKEPGSISNPSRVENPNGSAPRRGRFFGLFPAPGPLTSSAASREVRMKPTDPGLPTGRSLDNHSAATTTGASKVDNDAEGTLKRRIERQAREVIGDRARTIDVQVTGKSAVIRVRGVRLFQKRNVKRAVEGIPALAGLRSNVDVGD